MFSVLKIDVKLINFYTNNSHFCVLVTYFILDIAIIINLLHNIHIWVKQYNKKLEIL